VLGSLSSLGQGDRQPATRTPVGDGGFQQVRNNRDRYPPKTSYLAASAMMLAPDYYFLCPDFGVGNPSPTVGGSPPKRLPPIAAAGGSQGAPPPAAGHQQPAGQYLLQKQLPFLPQAVRTAAGATTAPIRCRSSKTPSPVPIPFSQANTFSVGRIYPRALVPPAWFGTPQTSTAISNLTAGLVGTVFGNYSWDLFYTHGGKPPRRWTISTTRTTSDSFGGGPMPLSIRPARLFCYATTPCRRSGGQCPYMARLPRGVAATPYNNCVPLNPFGPTSISQSAYAYMVGNDLLPHDQYPGRCRRQQFSGTAFEGWAGPIKVRTLGGKARWNGYTVASQCLVQLHGWIARA